MRVTVVNHANILAAMRTEHRMHKCVLNPPAPYEICVNIVKALRRPWVVNRCADSMAENKIAASHALQQQDTLAERSKALA